MDLIFANGALSPTALVIRGTMISTRYYFGIRFIDVFAVGTLFVGVADGFETETATLEVVVVTLVPEEFAVTQWTLRGGCGEQSTCQRSFGFREIGTVLAFTGRTPFAAAGMP